MSEDEDINNFIQEISKSLHSFVKILGGDVPEFLKDIEKIWAEGNSISKGDLIRDRD